MQPHIIYRECHLCAHPPPPNTGGAAGVARRRRVARAVLARDAVPAVARPQRVPPLGATDAFRRAPRPDHQHHAGRVFIPILFRRHLALCTLSRFFSPYLHSVATVRFLVSMVSFAFCL